MQSFKKKIVSLAKNGIDPLIDGVTNFNNPNKEVELLANERKEVCVKCPMFVDEPIPFLSVQDDRIKELSNKICDECGCTLSYKLRQSKTKCDKWKE